MCPENVLSISNTLFNQKSPVHQEAGFPNVDRQTRHGHRNL